MFDATEIKIAFLNLIGWRQHYSVDFQIDEELTTTETGEFYQQKHAALDLVQIRTILHPDKTLNEFLKEVVQDSAVEICNDILQVRMNDTYGKTLLKKAMLLNKSGWKNEGILNQNRFVGFHITPKLQTGLRVLIHEIGLQFQQPTTFTMYLFHTDNEEPILEFEVNTLRTSWQWTLQELILRGFEHDDYNGGSFVLGYYQEDTGAQAINLSSFDWNKGACGSCNSGSKKQWNTIKKYLQIYPLYVPEGAYEKGKMFELKDAIYTGNHNWGMNFKLTVECDLTRFFIESKHHLKNLLALKVTHKVLQYMKFSQQINYVEENLKMMIIRDLEGDKQTNYLNIVQQYNRELKAVEYNISGINKECLPCREQGLAPEVSYI